MQNSIDINLPDIETRPHKGFILDNGLKVIVVSDPETTSAAAALSVGVGSLHDPEEYQGLAHFLEHMLFLGTEKYPDENVYQKFLSMNSGSSNAYTASMITNYYFDVIADKLEGALDIFAQFFISPLFTESATDRELNAVDSEHGKNVQTDSRRDHAVIKKLMDSSHPYSFFSTGNKETLLKENIREALLAFHEKYYSANIMNLFVIGKELTSMVERLFSGIKNNNVVVEDVSPDLFTPGTLPKLVKYAPVTPKKMLRVLFPMPSDYENKTVKPSRHFSHLFGHESEGSIYALLKSKGWATELVSGSTCSTHYFDMLRVDIKLTDKGFEHYEEVASIIFAYIRMLKKEGIQKWIHDEISLVSSTEFRFFPKSSASRYAPAVSAYMAKYGIENCLKDAYVISDYNQAAIENVLEYFNTENFMYESKFCLTVSMILQSPEFAELEHTDREHWYEMDYTVANVDDKLIEKVSIDTSYEDQLHLPIVNPFLPTNFDLVPVNDETPDVPELVISNEHGECWVCKESVFKEPKVNAIVLLCGDVYSTPDLWVKGSILIKLLEDSINEYVYYSDIAGLEYKIDFDHRGIIFVMYGYSDKLGVLLKFIFEKLDSLEVNEDRFLHCKETTLLAVKKQFVAQPYLQAAYFFNTTNNIEHFTHEEKLEAIDAVTSEDIKAFKKHILGTNYVKSFFHGNVTIDDGKVLHNYTLNTLQKGDVMPKDQIMKKTTIKHESGKHYIINRENLNKADNNSCIIDFYQVCTEDDERLANTVKLIGKLTDESYFNTLRTEQQLGYIVWSGEKNNFGSVGFRVIVQSTVLAPFGLAERIKSCNEKEELQNLDEEEFNAARDTVARKTARPFESMLSKFLSFWDEIYYDRLVFDRRQRNGEMLKQLSKEEVVTTFANHVVNDEKAQCTVYVTPTSMEKEEVPTGDNTILIEDVEYKRTAPKHHTK